jgi:ectoine hydroxylase-related dioxygenase (phytanoyl-CoA dioxygenase family)
MRCSGHHIPPPEAAYGERVAASLTRLHGPTTSVEDLVAVLDAEGVAVVEAILDPTAVAVARRGLEAVAAATPLGRNDFEGYATRRSFSLLAKTRAADRLVLDPLVRGAVQAVVGHHQLSVTLAIAIGPGETAQGLHTDDTIYPLPRPHDEVMVSCMWAIDEFTEANGATRIIPGSHRWGNEEYPPEGETGTPATMGPGSVLVWLGSTWHQGGANRTDRARLGVNFEYIASWLRPQENHLVAVPVERARTLPTEIVELLGYDVRPPFHGYVDGRHPRKYVDGYAVPPVEIGP